MSPAPHLPSLDLDSLRRAYRSGAWTAADTVAVVHDRIARRGRDNVWIDLGSREDALAQAALQEERRRRGEDLPLFGIPFAIKDNIDAAGRPTTAACPEFGYVAEQSATVVDRLVAAGALLIGKTNLDQFAAGLVGLRSPYGACSSVFDPATISGGSSSGSSVAVAAGLVSFALGTDTAGSGRVPAAFNNLVGWKPSRGLLSTRGVVPACRSLDCVSVLALTCADAAAVARVAGGFDPLDPYSRPQPERALALPAAFRFGVPAADRLKFFGRNEGAALFAAAAARLEALGGRAVEIDFGPFSEVADLLYSGPWVAERLAAIEPFFDRQPEALHPVTAAIIGGGRRYSAVDLFNGFHRLEVLRRRAEAEWKKIDLLLLPTAGRPYTIAEVEADPIQLNTNLGYYTNFVNLLDLCGVAVPAGFYADGFPFGATLLGPAFSDHALLALGARLQWSAGGPVGGTGVSIRSLPEYAPASAPAEKAPASEVELAVVGAHLRGQPLNAQLTSRGGVLARTASTAAGYRLFALAGTVPPKPALVRTPGFAGAGIEIEVWRLSEAAFGSFVAAVPPPMTIGSIELADGTSVKGFLCEPFAVEKARDITVWGGWRRYLGSLSASGRETLPDVPRTSAPSAPDPT